MKIAMMTNTYLPHVGGVARSVATFTGLLRSQGEEVLVVAPEFEGADGAEGSPTEEGVVRLPAIQNFNGSDYSVRLPLTWMLDPAIKGFGPDIVHSHHPYLLGDSALRFAAAKNAPVVFTHHTLYEQYTHYVPFDSPALKQFVIELCTHYANLCDGVIAPSESVAKIISDRGVTVPIEVLPTGVNLAGFGHGLRARFRKRHGIKLDTFVVGHLGRLAPEKNLEYLSRAVVHFLKQTRDSSFLVVGEGPSGQGLREVFEKEDLGPRLIMPGKQTGGDLHDAYAAMDLFAFSSLSETQGLVLAEAMAAGLPVVALDASGVREVVRDDTNGFLLDADAGEEAFAARLLQISRSGSLRRRFQKGARITARGFSEEVSLEKLTRFYRSVLKRTLPERQRTDEDDLGPFLKRIELEWGLIAEKTGAALDTLVHKSLSPGA